MSIESAEDDAVRSGSPDTSTPKRDPDPSHHSVPLPSSAPGTVVRLSSEQLLGSASEVEIDHEGTIYRLRRTSLGKLILTK